MHRIVCLFILLCPLAFAGNEKNDSLVLRIQFGSEPTQYDPLFLEDGTALRLAANVIATPFEYDGAGNLRNGLVRDYLLSRDKKKYTIHFKKNLKWSDGVKFHSNQFIAAVRRLVNEPVKSALSDLFPDFDLQKTRVIDPLTVELVLKTPDAQLKNWLTLPPFSPIRDDMIESFIKRNPVVPTLAAYQVVDYKRESHLLLKKNPEFEGADSVAIDQVKIVFLKDESSLYPLLRAGDLDILCKVPVLQYEQIRKVSKVTDVPVEAVTYLGFNTRKPPFNELKNRKAFLDLVSIKREELALMLKTGELPARTFLPQILMQSPVQASGSMMPSSQNKNDEQLDRLVFNVQSDGGLRNEMILQFLQSKLKDRYSWKMKIENLEWKAHYSRLKTAPDEVFRFGWQNPVSDPYVVYQVLKSDNVNNFTGWKNLEYDRLVDELRQETKMVKKAKLIERLETILAKEVPVVPIVHQVLRFANSKRIEGFRANPFGVILFRELRFAKKVN